MRLIIQRSKAASVHIDGIEKGTITHGFVVLIGVTHSDTEEDVTWLVQKLVNMRIFSDEEGKMNASLLDVSGQLLLISQFTLHASTKKGNRPGFTEAARPDVAIPLYELFVVKCRELVSHVATGEFGADMQVSLVNDGPVTIQLDSKNKE